MPFFPLPKIAHPDFCQLGKKPSGAVEIDWSNSLAKGLYKAFFAKSSGFFDAVTNDTYFGVSGISQKYGIKGEYNDCSGTQTVPIPERIYGNTEDFTVSWLASKDVATSNDGMVCGDTGSNNYYIYQSSTNNEISVKRQTDSSSLIISGVTHDQFVWRTIVVSASTSTIKYISARQVATSSILTKPFTLNNITFGYNNPGNKFDGKFQDIIFHDRALSETEVHALHADPYQILKPAVDLYAFWAAGGSTYTLTADNTTFTLGSDTVNLVWDRILTADNTAYTLGGDAVNLTYNPVGSYTLTADVTAYTLGGDAVNLFYNPSIIADVTAYTLSADAVNLTYTPVGAYTLTADVTAYTLGGDSVNLTYARIFTADETSYTLSFATATLTKGLLDTPNCYTWLISEIANYEYLLSDIDDSVTYKVSLIDDSVTYLVSDIDDSVLYLRGDLCS